MDSGRDGNALCLLVTQAQAIPPQPKFDRIAERGAADGLD